MKIEIDQSGKVEQTSVPTIIAAANRNNKFTIMIHQREKKKLLQFFRNLKQPKSFIFGTFSAVIFILIDHFSLKQKVICIDIEYKGNEELIKNHLIQLGLQSDLIRFKTIGKHSPAHFAAIESFRNRTADIIVSAEKILEVLSHIKKDQDV